MDLLESVLTAVKGLTGTFIYRDEDLDSQGA